jgi:hypothetical protein
MDFIERLFGVAPDGGDGSTELIYLTVLLIAIALAWRLRKRNAQTTR